jgi:hypothetical protein
LLLVRPGYRCTQHRWMLVVAGLQCSGYRASAHEHVKQAPQQPHVKRNLHSMLQDVSAVHGVCTTLLFGYVCASCTSSLAARLDVLLVLCRACG